MPEIPLNGGLITQADPEEVGIQGCTELVNGEFDKIGRIYKRKGAGAELLGNDALNPFHEIIRFIHPSLGTGAEWIIIRSSTGVVYHSSDFSSLTSLGDLGTITVNDFVFATLWGKVVRFNSSSVVDDPKILQYIDRDFFWDKVKWDATPAFNLETARPKLPASAYFSLQEMYNFSVLSGFISNPMDDADNSSNNWFLDITDISETKTAYDEDKYLTAVSSLDLTLDSNKREYYYKYSLIKDGINETPLSPQFVNTSSLANNNKTTPFFILRKSDANVRDVRVTGINIYRKSNVAGSTYKKISSISTLDEDKDENLVTKNDGNIGQTAFVPGNTYTPTGALLKLRVNGYTHKLTTNSDDEILKLADDEEGGGGAVSIGWGTGGYLTTDAGVYTDNNGIYRDADDRAWGDPWAITFTRLNSDMNSGNFESGDLSDDGWTASGGTLEGNGGEVRTDASLAFRGTRFIRMYIPAGTLAQETYYLKTPPYAVTAGLTYYADVMMMPFTTYSLEAKDEFKMQITCASSEGGTYSNVDGAVAGNKGYKPSSTKLDTTWYKASNKGEDYECVRVSFTVPVGMTHCKVKFSLTNVASAGGTEPRIVRFDQFYIAQQKAIGNECYGGPEVYTSSTLDLQNDDKAGDLYSMDAWNSSSSEVADTTANFDMGYVAGNRQKAIWKVRQFSGSDAFSDKTFFNNSRIFLNKDYLWRSGGGTTTDLWFIDKGLIDSAEHPYEGLSMNTKFKHSQELNGRQFVGDVTITNDAGAVESHDDWIVYSNLGTPDIIPISNYIQITDLHGGKIKKLGRILGDLVIFMEKGIFRLNIPNDDPTNWSLMESYPNIGLTSSWGIVNWNSGYFFMSRDAIYYLDVNFGLKRCTDSIKDLYQSLVPDYSEAYPARYESSHLSVDEKNKKLLFTTPSSTNYGYSMDLSKYPEEFWSKEEFSFNPKGYITDENLDSYLVDWSNTGSDTSVRKVKVGNNTTSFKRTTGWISGGSLEGTMILKRINLRYNSGDAITVKVYTDGDTTTAKTWSDGNTYGTLPANTSGTKYIRLRPSIRCKYFMIEVSTVSSTNDVEINKMEFEVG